LPGKKAHKSALKAVRRDARKTVYRGTVRSSTRTHVKKAQALIASGKGPDPSQAVLEAISALDKAAQKGVIHKNQAARRKSRLMAALNRARATAA
jgi:small subunit ribosomal protein S20